MTAKPKVTKPKVVEVEKDAKLYDVFDVNGSLINIYKSKGDAEIVVEKGPTQPHPDPEEAEKGGLVPARTMAPSPKGRTRADVKVAADERKVQNLKELEQNAPKAPTA